jgi:hypothetical protein
MDPPDVGDRAKTVAKATVTAVAVAYLLSTVDVAAVADSLGGIDLRLLAVAVGVTVVGVFLSTAKWLLLLRSKGESPGYRRLVVAYFTGTFFNAFLPTTIGGDGVRAYATAGDVDDSMEAYSSVYVERFTGLVALCGFAVLASALRPDLVSAQFSLVLAGLVVGTSVLSSVFVVPSSVYVDGIAGRLPDWIGSRVERFYGSARDYRGERRTLAYALSISVAFQALPILNHWLLAVALGIEVSVVYLAIMVPLAEAILFLPISIRGYGVREVLYAFFLVEVGVPAAGAIALSVAVQFVGLLQSAIGGVVYLLFYSPSD